MIRTILEASENFCIHQIRAVHSISDIIPQTKTYITYIDIITLQEEKFRVYVACEKNLVQRVSKIFLEEETSSEETLIDMALEIANLIIGSAKVIAEKKDERPYSIGTPHFEKFHTFNFEYEQAKLITLEDDVFIIAVKEIN